MTKSNKHNTNIDRIFSYTTTSTWKEYPLKNNNSDVTQKKWAWCSSLTFKSKKALKLKQIKLRWNGDKIDFLFASLFKKQKNENCVIPIEENLVSDGTWNSQTQEIVFYLNEKILIENKYHLVLSFPKSMETTIKKGSFVLVEKKSQEHSYK